MSDLVVLAIKDGAYYEAGTVDPPDRQKRVRTLQEWITEHGEDGVTYRLAGWLTPAMTARKTITFDIQEEPEPAAEESEEGDPNKKEAPAAAEEAVAEEAKSLKSV